MSTIKRFDEETLNKLRMSIINKERGLTIVSYKQIASYIGCDIATVYKYRIKLGYKPISASGYDRNVRRPRLI